MRMTTLQLSRKGNRWMALPEDTEVLTYLGMKDRATDYLYSVSIGY
jgi:hypothetical protein